MQKTIDLPTTDHQIQQLRNALNHNATDAESRFSGVNPVVQRIITEAEPEAIQITDGILLFDSTNNEIEIDLPAASEGKYEIRFKDIGLNSLTNNITFNRVGSDTIVDVLVGETSTIIADNGFSGSFLSNGTDTWYLLT